MTSPRLRCVEAKMKDFGLTPLEKQIIALVLAGYTTKESGQQIGVSGYSVRQHLRRVMAKLGVTNRLELVLFALHYDLIDLVQKSPRRSPRVTKIHFRQIFPAKRAAG